MKLETTISPRRDGAVNVDLDGSRYSFTADADGALVCDVANEEHAAKLLCMGDRFLPADDADMEAAKALVAGSNHPPVVDDDEEPNMNAAPIEEPASAVAAKAPAKVGRPKKAR